MLELRSLGSLVGPCRSVPHGNVVGRRYKRSPFEAVSELAVVTMGAVYAEPFVHGNHVSYLGEEKFVVDQEV